MSVDVGLGKRVLLVDDDDDLRSVVGACLRFRGFEVIEASNGTQAEALMRLREPDLILSDVRMPRGDGIELLRSSTGTATILMTGHSETSSAEVLALGAKTLLHKPFDLKELFAAIDIALGSAAAT